MGSDELTTGSDTTEANETASLEGANGPVLVDEEDTRGSKE